MEKEKGLLASLWDSFSSLRLSIGLLILLAVVSIFGTVIPQNASPEEYLRAYKVSTYKILKILGFLDMYHTPWFIFLLALLCLSLVACSLKRFRVTWKFFASPMERLEEGQWKAMGLKRRLAAQVPPDQALPLCQETLSRTFAVPKLLDKSVPPHLFAEKAKISHLGVYFIHGSILIILAGALIGLFLGFRGNLILEEGQATDRVILRNGREVQLPGFQIGLDKFNVSFYPTGAPKEFKSTVSILEGREKRVTEPIRVNHPLSYRGITFYQSTYGVSGMKKAVLLVKDRQTGRETAVTAQMGARTAIPGTAESFVLAQFVPDFQGMGPALQVLYFADEAKHENFLLLQRYPEMSEKKSGRYLLTIKEIEPRYYSGLQVTKDPGVWVVWAGCLLMILGFYLAFFMSHRRLWMRLTAKGGGSLVEIAGASHKDRLGFEKEFAKIEQALNEKLR